MGDTLVTARPKIAIITGGASGFGHAVASALASRADEKWSIHVLDLNAQAGQSAAKGIGAHFHQCDIADYSVLASTFHSIYQAERRLDFVFANAGIIEKFDFYQDHVKGGDGDEAPPPPPDLTVVDVNVKGTINTSWLAMHYFRQTAKKRGQDIDKSWGGSLVLTASVASQHPTWGTPVYAGTKHAVLGFVRSIAPRFLADANVRVNAVLPSIVRTNLADVSAIPERVFTPIDSVVRAVLMLLDGKTIVDSDGVEVEGRRMYGKAVEVSLHRFRFREQVAFGDEALKELLSRPLEFYK